MNDLEFAELVMKMRAAQKNYFATRNTDWLNESKKLEKQVDAILWPKPDNSQKNFILK